MRSLFIAAAVMLMLGPVRGAGTREAMPTPTNVFTKGAGWPVGETLTYHLYWGVIPVGIATGWSEWTQKDGRTVLAIRVRTKSNRVIEKLYPVDDTIESLIDPDTMLPLQFTKNLSEGTHRKHEVTVFDHAAGIARWESRISGKKKEFPIEATTRDIPSFMYAMRTHQYRVGQKEQYRVMADEKIYDLWLTVQKRETMDLPHYENVKTLKIEPEAAFDGLFVRKGRMWIWVSEDPRCVATKVVAEVPVATVRAVLMTVEGPGDDSWTRKAPSKAP